MGTLMETTDVTLGTARPAGLRDFRGQIDLFGAMGTPGEFYSDTVHTIAINTRETEFGRIVEPIPIVLKTYKQFQNHEHPRVNGYEFPAHPTINSLTIGPRLPEFGPSASVLNPSPVKEAQDSFKNTRAPPKKKWIREYLEEEPKSPVSLRVVSVARTNGVVRVPSPPSPVPVAVTPAVHPAPGPLPAPASAPEPQPQPLPLPLVTAAPTLPPPPAAQIVDFAQEHSRPRTTSITATTHGSSQIPSPPSAGSSSSGSGGGTPRAGTREVHNKLEKNRRAHLKECFEMLKRQLPATPDDKKTSNLSILGSAIRYIQVLRRKERECEHEMERLAREKIASQQRLAALKREVTSVRQVTARARPLETIADDKEIEDRVNGHVLGISIASSPPRGRSPPISLNLSTKLRALPVQITPTTAQNGVIENGVTTALSTLVHPAQIHLPISQVGVGVGGGGVVVSGAALQLLSGSLHLLQPRRAPRPALPAQTPHHLQLHHLQPQLNGVCAVDSGRVPRTENGIVSLAPVSTDGTILVNVVSPLAPAAAAAVTATAAATTATATVPASGIQLLHAHTHTLTHKMVDRHSANGTVSPVSVSGQYLSPGAGRPAAPMPVPAHAHVPTPAPGHTHT